MHEVVERMIKVCKSFTNLNLQRQRSPLAPVEGLSAPPATPRV